MYWDENIALPIPFFDQLLKYYSQKEGYQETAKLAVFLLENRPAQRKTAQKGLVTLAGEAMKQFSSVQQIASLREEVSFLPDAEALPEDYLEAFQPLDDISENCRKALLEYNLTNRLRLWKAIESQVSEFQKTANFSKKHAFVAFSRVGIKWREIIRREIEKIQQEVGLPLPNPFITGPPIKKKEKELFVGRRDIINQIQTEALREGTMGAILFTGNRRTGKTSTLYNLDGVLPSFIQPLFFDCQSPSLQGGLDTFSKAVGQEVATALKINVPQPAANLVQLHELLAQANRQLGQSNHYLLLCFDEYERLGARIADNTLRGLADSFRFWIQQFDRLVLLFAGSHEFSEVSEVDWTDYLINVRTVYISYLEESAALHLVTQPVPEFDLVYEPADLPQKMVNRLGRQPYLLQSTMSELVEILNQDSHRKIAYPEDIDRAITAMFRTATNYLAHFWEHEVSEQGRQVLLSLAKGKAVDGDSAAVKRLIRKEILRKGGQGLEFCVPVVGEWVRENY